jgi:hypothetical protein
MDQLQTWCESIPWSATQLIVFTLTFGVCTSVKNGVPQGYNLKLKKSYRVVPDMKVLDECFPDKLKY